MSQARLIKTWETPGGVHPPENKSQSMQLPLAELSIPSILVFPLSQHIGTPAAPIVSVGETVLAGQKIAEPVGAMSAAIHASTSGTITAIEERVLPHVSGMQGLCIVMESDQQHRHINTEGLSDYRLHSPQELLALIREAGITGMGGAGFPTAIKLNPKSDTPIKTLIINGTECEPYITADDRIMQDFADDIVQGTALLSYILGEPERVIIGIEDNKPDAIRNMQAAVNKLSSPRIEVVSFPTKYPSGGEKQLIQILTGKEVPSGQIPASLGIVVQNVGTAMAAYRAIALGQPLTWRVTTVVGETLKTQRNVKALLGTPISHLLEENGFNASASSKVIMGGPMMGFALPSTDVPVIKTTNCIIAPSKTEVPEPPPAQACIRCGLCAEACPASLLPQQLYWYAKADDYDKCQNYNLFDCIECGACSYVCPSTIPLVQYYRAAKGEIREREQEKIKSDHARQRFEFRKQRIEQAEKEKEAKRQARKEAAAKAKALAAEKAAANKDDTDTATPASSDPVAAAMARVQAKQQDPVVQKAKLERAFESAKSRCEKLQQRIESIEESESDQKEKLSAQLKQAEVRLRDAEKNLNAFSMGSDSIGPDSQSEKPALKPAPPKALDAASAAIERAKAKADAMAQMSPKEKLQNQIASLETRVQKAQEKVKQAEAEESEHIDALRMGLEKMQAKLAQTQDELRNLG